MPGVRREDRDAEPSVCGGNPDWENYLAALVVVRVGISGGAECGDGEPL